MTRGFLISAQFRDFGICSGKFHDSAMRWYEFENSLAFGNTVNDSKEEIAGEVQKVLKALQPILTSGKEKIKETIDQWTFGPFDEKVRNDVLVYFGFPGIDPYSEAYMTEKVDFFQEQRFSDHAAE